MPVMEKSRPGSVETKVVKVVCNGCTHACGMDVYVSDGRIVKLDDMKEHPRSELCFRARRFSGWVYAKDRVTTPLRKVDGRWQEVSWDEALGIVSDKLIAIREKYGAKAVVINLGIPFIGSHVEKIVRRFADLYGTPNYTSGASFCFFARIIGHDLTLGRAAIIPDFSGTKCMVNWGTNTTESNHMFALYIAQAKSAGAKLIVVDPRKTATAKRADIHAQLRPGTDAALALGMLHVIIGEELYDKPFVEQWTVGFERLAEYVRQYTPERVEEITWVPAEVVRRMARMYATSQPATLFPGISIDHCTNGIQTYRAMATLIAITGNFDVRGGNRYATGLPQKNLRFPDRVNPRDAIGTGFPFFAQFSHESTVTPITEALLTGKPYPVKGFIVHGCNPALILPNASKVREALGKLELLVVIDLFMTETAKMADMFLPAATFFERKVLKDYGGGADLPLIMIGDRAIEPPGKCMVDWQIWAELGKRMGYGEYFPWGSDDELFDTLLEGTKISADELRRSPSGIIYAPVEERRYLKKGFHTPSGKVEIYSERMEKLGYDPLPTFHEPAESPVTNPSLADKYPLILISGARTKAFTHSQHRNVAALREYMPEPLVEINTRTARGLGIASRDMVVVQSLRGSIRLRASVTDEILPGVVSIQHGWNEANVNLLTDHTALDPVSGFPGYKQVLCRVTKA